jgi:hypothetical protein
VGGIALLRTQGTQTQKIFGASRAENDPFFSLPDLIDAPCWRHAGASKA